MTENLHSPQRLLIELRIEHADLDNLIDRAEPLRPVDELTLRRLKKRRLALRDEIQKTQQLLVLVRLYFLRYRLLFVLNS